VTAATKTADLPLLISHFGFVSAADKPFATPVQTITNNLPKENPIV
jgi:hypothetical protein